MRCDETVTMEAQAVVEYDEVTEDIGGEVSFVETTVENVQVHSVYMFGRDWSVYDMINTFGLDGYKFITDWFGDQV